MKKIFRIFGKTVLFFFLWSVISVIGYRFVPVYFTPLMGIRMAEQISEGRKPEVKHKWVPDRRISNNMKRAVLASEDQRFFNHNGFDKVEIKKALKENKTRKRPRGASTISQQTAKNVFLWPRSSWLRKGLEAYFTVLIEFFWTKERILTVYLNCMETGDGIYGVEAVAREHFNTTAEKLSASQSALVAATLPNPLKFSSKKPSSYMKQRQSYILRQMRTVQHPPVSEKN
ncbi:MAG: monofunctional biosynthetic peptidoglycan transglycosylase [Petrimonas sp.]|jgi:monofunctional biosynthetic peptidoglycan transglycosylase|uniref:monofunctional biosynthetic peptidoglycan transglycosylase n=1 Tax=Petrimonas sp. TaxID=2023866 RepID=UPI000E8EF5F2|nr:monofunctional biosynthetic peptidoglycan transglycosylase [Kaistella sp.]MEA4996548.1 monofunctional biosynthetic peptidoglycan transglycosylase [Petrimonas sp.]MEA5045271.1 monofunctional biosynthetic peptidoglycan transglycosylase [Petrimonas sp.]HBC39578.1 monofunctional biosynthetic peptidoglycan transglycosylase [Porphyromonadaceae bacterium]